MKENSIGSRPLNALSLGALWFAAAVSLAEIATGGLFAEAGFSLGFFSSVAGHLVGALFFFGAGWISWKRGKKAIAVCEDSFGPGGPKLFGALNFIQLVGWTAVMIIVGARSMDQVMSSTIGFGSETVWRIVLGIMIFAWAVLGPSVIGNANTLAAGALIALCVIISVIVFGPLVSGQASAAAKPGSVFAFGAGFELALIMPLSWLPLVGDYVSGAVKGRRSLLASASAYTVGSIWMYAIGLGAMLAFGTGDPVSLMKGPWTLAALAVVLLSTLTTAFLDAFSAGISLKAALPKISESAAVIIASVLGAALSLVAPVEQYETFLYLIGSVFAPLYAVLFSDFLFRREAAPRDRSIPTGRYIGAFVCWAIGVVVYQLFSAQSTIVGITVPVMALVGGLYTLFIIQGERVCASLKR